MTVFKWTPETRERAILLSKSLPITDIAADLGASHETIRYFFIIHDIQPVRTRAKSDKAALKAARLARMFQSKPPTNAMMGVRFENVTKDEARAIAANAPRSGKPPQRRQHYSIIGCAAAMCVQP